jgi:hypothetical protein
MRPLVDRRSLDAAMRERNRALIERAEVSTVVRDGRDFAPSVGHGYAVECASAPKGSA